ncbi:MAG TPA: UxaA family hydrolase [Deltaproteobacteria bacterium]|nr:UxaA family hydrolase [Deltaproteobacteria bacterium]
MKPNVVVIKEQDNVAVALEDIPGGGIVIVPGGDEFPALEKIPYSHKVALFDIPSGCTVRKYGESIGCASLDIRKGAWVHTHNLTVEAGIS